MGGSEGESVRISASQAYTTNTGDCCEALTAVAAEIIVRRRSTSQSIRSGWKLPDNSTGAEDAVKAGDIGSPHEPQRHPDYKGFSRLPPCLPVTINFRDVSLKVKIPRNFTGRMGLPVIRKVASIIYGMQSKTLLQAVSGTIHPGDMVALMGASGAGKSTLLNVLSRRLSSNGGSVSFNSKAMSASEVKRICCYIQQSDIFYGLLTVSEHLDCVARLRTGWTKERRKNLVEYLLDLYGLAKVRDSRIGDLTMTAERGISGGEKKRLNIATEMMTNPSVIFADEPTTGLDSFTSENVMRMFKLLADQGRTIVCTIHQPSSTIFNMFSKVLLLSQGRVVFFGDREATVLYFSRLGHPLPPFTSLPEFLLEVLVKHQLSHETKHRTESRDLTPERLAALWSETGPAFLEEWLKVREKFTEDMKCAEAFQNLRDDVSTEKEAGIPGELDTPHEIPKLYRASWCEELRTLLRRSSITNSRNPRVFQARVAQTLILALLAGLIYLRLDPQNYLSRNGASIFIVLNQGSLGMVSVLQTFTADKVLAIREYNSGLYSLSSYYFAKIAADFFLQIVFPIVFATITWYMIGFNDAVTRWLIGLGFITLATNSATSIGYLVSSLAPTLQYALAMIPIVFMPLILVSGFTVISSSVPKFWIWLQFLSPFRWGWAGFMRAVWEGVVLEKCPPNSFPPQCYSTGEQVLKYYEIESDAYWFSAMILLVQIVVYRSLALVGLLLVNRRR